MKNSSAYIKNMVYIALFTAIAAVLSQIALPLPTNVPITLQTFAVALTGFFLGWKNGTAALVVYVLLGAVGAPVFSGFKGGLGVLTGYTGGFIIGFVLMAAVCGIAVKLFKPQELKGKLLINLIGIAGLLLDHIIGVVWYSAVAEINLAKSFLVVSVPFLAKDIISVIAAYLISEELIKRLRFKN